MGEIPEDATPEEVVRHALDFERMQLASDARIIDLDVKQREAVKRSIELIKGMGPTTSAFDNYLKEIKQLRKVRALNYLRWVLEELSDDIT